jgi:site-specific recombinase
LFVEGFLIGTDYAIPFVLLQILHFALATKQPSMTAAAGWAENFLVFNRISHALVQHPLSHRFGTRHMARMAGWLERNAAGWSNSIVLGYLLGLTPVIARFFGHSARRPPCHAEHRLVARAAAQSGLDAFRHGRLYLAIAGIAVTFVLNLSVSFTIASVIALRAYSVPGREQVHFIYPGRSPHDQQ